MKVEDPVLTIVIPAYNVEKYLGQCLDSLLEQTVINHRIVVVNDGSTDETGAIAESYAKKYPDMIQYIRQINRGLGAARNVGLSQVTTPYVTFLDSDDWQDTLFMEKLVRELDRQEEAPDLIFSLPWIFDAPTHRLLCWYDKPLLEGLFYPNGGDENVASCVLNASQKLDLYALEPNACRRIYRTRFLQENHFAFPVGVKWEDVKPHFELIHNAKRCIAIKSTGFFYRVNTGGQITAGGGASRLDIVPVFRDTLNMAKQQNWSELEIAYILRMLWSFTTWSIDVTNTEYIAPLLKELHVFFRSIPKRYFNTYFNLCSLHRRTEMAKTWILRSPFYLLLKDYWLRQTGMRLAYKLVRKH